MKKASKWLVATVAILLVVALVAGCSSTPAASGAPASASEAASASAAPGASTEASATLGVGGQGGETITEPINVDIKTVDFSKVKIGILASQTKEDGGWTQSNYAGFMAMKEKLGLKDDQIQWVEDVPATGPDAANIIESMIADGTNLIFVTSSSNYDAVVTESQKHPEVNFNFFNGPVTKNLTSYSIRDYESIFLTGYLSAKMSSVDTLGYVAANPEASVVRAIDSYAAGAKYANPKAKVKMVWVNSWYDPAKEKEAANSLIATGVKVLGMQGSSPSVQQAAEAAGIYSIGFHVDMRQYGPKANLTSFMWNWEPIYTDIVTRYASGDKTGHNYFWGIDKGCAGIAPINTDLVKPELIKEVEGLSDKIKSGEVKVFVGPLSDNEGTQLLKDGEVFSDQKLQDLGFLLDNVEGALPKADAAGNAVPEASASK